MARVFLRRLAETRAVERTAALVERLDSSRPRILRVLTYHRVERAAPFASHMEHLAARHRVVSAAQVTAALEGGPELPRRSVLLTFDDADRSFARVAWPILRSHGFAAVLFVPTAYPDSLREGFWWERLERALLLTERRQPLETPLGLLPLATPAERARAHALLKPLVKDLPHEEALRMTGEICSALGVPATPHDVLGWDELRALAAQGVTLGAHSRTHPRLDRIPRDNVRSEVLGSLADLEREIPLAAPIFAYPDGRHDDEIVELLRSAGVELAFTTRRGTNDLLRCDPLRLRRLCIDARDSLAVLHAKMAFTAARLDPALRLLAPRSAAERSVERRHRSQMVRSKYVLRALDAVLTAGLGQRNARPAQNGAARRWSRSERLQRITRLALDWAPPLEPMLTRALVSPERLPLRAAGLELRGSGSACTVFRLEQGAGARPWALKVHRRTLGRDVHCLETAARRCMRRYQRLRAAFGEVVLPGRFLVLHSPLRGARAVACLQPWLTGHLHDLLGLDDRKLRALLGQHPALARCFATFARQVLAWGEEGLFPDLLGPGNLVAAEEAGEPRLWLIDYGIFDRRESADLARRAAEDAMAERLRALLQDGVVNGDVGI